MPSLTANEIKPGMKVEIDKDPYAVISNQFVKPGKGQAFCRIRVKNLMTSRVVEKTYKSGEKLELADVTETQMRMLYEEPDGVVFMDETSYEQLTIPFSVIGDHKPWLKEDTLYEVIFYKEQPIDLIPPTFMSLQVTETAPGVRGDTASGRVLKPAILETGAKVQIPIFIEEGEMIKVDTRTGDYVSRV
jgi:elongation factor P